MNNRFLAKLASACKWKGGSERRTGVYTIAHEDSSTEPTQPFAADEYWMQQALMLAEQAAREGEVPVGALLIDKNQRLIAKAYNQTIQQIDPTAHAEILVLRQAALNKNNYRLPGTTLYCTLEPCAMCAGAIIQARLDRVVFAAYDARAGAVSSVFQLLNHDSLNHRASCLGNILADQSITLMQNFFRSRR